MTFRTLLGLLLLTAACTASKPQFTDGGVTDANQTDASAPLDGGVDAGIDAAAATGRPGQATVSGAVKASSPGYTLYGTLRSGDGSSASPSYQRRGGVTGATQP